MNSETEIFICQVCGISGTDQSVILKGYCHNISNSRHSGDDRITEIRNKKKQHIFKGTSIRKFNKYFDEDKEG